MATGLGVAEISIAQLNSPTPITPCLMQEWGSYLPHMPSYSQFCVRITVVGCHGNKGQSGVNFKDTVRLADHEYPQFGANSVHVSSKVPELWLLEVVIGCVTVGQLVYLMFCVS